MSVSDKLLMLFIGLWLGITTGFFAAGLAVWGWLWLVILIAVAVAEIVSKATSGRTITQRFKAFALAHRTKAVVLLVAMTVVWALLLLHLVL